jgi:hypothetical protein
MRAICTTMIDGFELVCGVGRPVYNPEGSKRQARERLGPDATYHEMLIELTNNPVYFGAIPGQSNISDEDCEELEDKLRLLRDNEKLTRAGVVVLDNRGREWFSLCDDEIWTRGRIETIGETLPNGAVWSRDLTREQVKSIREQDESLKISRMSLEARRQAADGEIQAAKRRAVNMRLEAEITEESEALEHARRYYKTELSRILSRYGLPDTPEVTHEY